jgi:hypothetical protein
MKYNVTVYFIGASLKNILKTTKSFTNKDKAIEYAEDELAWENTQRVVCEELNFDEQGDYA